MEKNMKQPGYQDEGSGHVLSNLHEVMQEALIRSVELTGDEHSTTVIHQRVPIYLKETAEQILKAHGGEKLTVSLYIRCILERLVSEYRPLIADVVTR